MIAKETEELSDAELDRIGDALKVSLFRMDRDAHARYSGSVRR